MKLSPGDLNPDPFLSPLSHPTSIYICGVIIAPRVRGGRHNTLCIVI